MRGSVNQQTSISERFPVKDPQISSPPELRARLDKIREKSPVTVIHWSKRAEELQEMVERNDRTSTSLREDSHPSVGDIMNLIHLLEISDAEKQFIDQKRKAWVKSAEQYLTADRNAYNDLLKTSEGVSLLEKAALEKADKQAKMIQEFLSQKRKHHFQSFTSEYEYEIVRDKRVQDLVSNPAFDKLVRSHLSETSLKSYVEVTNNYKTAKHENNIVWKLNETTMKANLTDAQRQAAYEVYSKNPNAKPEALKGILTDAQIKMLGK
ncbi:MAG: hypothetical protein HC845_04805 [Akkermansiaceae bacterium]|nr:hypothetical protein [Akkermansiaceae bacterium]